jgi:SAM-dependent methyltransferase
MTAPTPPPLSAPAPPAPDPLSATRPAPASWHRFSATDHGPEGPQTTVAVYGADMPTEADLRLLGRVQGKRVLDLGCGVGQAAVTFARQGAKVIGVDVSADRLAAARRLADEEGVHVELHRADLAELAFVRADTMDAAFSAFALAEVVDLNRVFRQVHRVLKPEAPLVFTLPHPAFLMLNPRAAKPLRVVRAYDDPTPLRWTRGADERTDHPRTIGQIFTALGRANFRVDTLLEPTAPAGGAHSPWFADVMRHVPATVLFRARKQGN